jgi:hypothetical protein
MPFSSMCFDDFVLDRSDFDTESAMLVGEMIEDFDVLEARTGVQIDDFDVLECFVAKSMHCTRKSRMWP